MRHNEAANDFYKTISLAGMAEYKDRGSRFIAYAFPIETTAAFKLHIDNLKKEHPKAVHFCFAYRIGFDGNNFRSSDNGEPAGTAGKPILGQIDSKELTNVLVVVVRYFGGTLLGVPGLINAYKTAAALALQVVPVIQKPITQKIIIHFGYAEMNAVMRLIKLYDAAIIAQEKNLFCKMEMEISKTKATLFSGELKKITGIEFEKENL